MWNQTEAFCGKPWVWCNIQNFGNTVRLGGALDKIAGDLPLARRHPESGQLAGLGFVNEGLGYNPVVFDLLFQIAWRDEPVDLDTWIAEYAHQRYGSANDQAASAWRGLLATVYGAPSGSRSIIDRVPTVKRGQSVVPYNNARLAEAWGALLQASDQLGNVDTYRYDLVNVNRQLLSNYATVLHHELVQAWESQDLDALEKASESFLQLIRDLDQLLATRREFLLGRCLEDAKRWGTKPSEEAQFEWNARRVLTLWGEGPMIDDYARKDWSGMLDGYYGKRWSLYLAQLARSLRENEPLDGDAFGKTLREWMVQWSDSRETYPTETRGDSVAVSKALWQKYRDAFKPNAVSLTTGKPATCSHALASYPAHLANDGWSNNTDAFWATDVGQHPDAWWQVDLQALTSVGRVVVVGYYGDRRHYGFTVETSQDGATWELVADRRDNSEPATHEGYTCRFEPRPVRYIRVTQTQNSANTGRHLVEVMAYER
jgi:alpha-N-acetylglucosaminidase